MASLSCDKNGTKRVLFTDMHGERKTIRLGRVSKAVGCEVKLHVERLNLARRTNTVLHPQTAAWLTDRAWLGCSGAGRDAEGRAMNVATKSTEALATCTIRSIRIHSGHDKRNSNTPGDVGRVRAIPLRGEQGDGHPRVHAIAFRVGEADAR